MKRTVTVPVAVLEQVGQALKEGERRMGAVAIASRRSDDHAAWRALMHARVDFSIYVLHEVRHAETPNVTVLA